jgi:methionine biosynthesis protein MetW
VPSSRTRSVRDLHPAPNGVIRPFFLRLPPFRMTPAAAKRTIDMQVLADWIEPEARVLDLGCGRGVLLEFLAQTRRARAFGVDLDFAKITACVRRGLSAYQGDMLGYMRALPDGHFDHVVCSRTLEEVPDPAAVIAEALRVGRAVTVGFANHGYWKNRYATLLLGRKPVNPVYPAAWQHSRPANPATIADFEAFATEAGYRVARRAHLRGDWKSPCVLAPNLLAGYALYQLTR